MSAKIDGNVRSRVAVRRAVVPLAMLAILASAVDVRAATPPYGSANVHFARAWRMRLENEARERASSPARAAVPKRSRLLSFVPKLAFAAVALNLGRQLYGAATGKADLDVTRILVGAAATTLGSIGLGPLGGLAAGYFADWLIDRVRQSGSKGREARSIVQARSAADRSISRPGLRLLGTECAGLGPRNVGLDHGALLDAKIGVPLHAR